MSHEHVWTWPRRQFITRPSASNRPSYSSGGPSPSRRAGLAALSAFFSSSETAIFTLTDEWVTEQESLGAARIAVFQELRSDPRRLLVTVLVGNDVITRWLSAWVGGNVDVEEPCVEE